MVHLDTVFDHAATAFATASDHAATAADNPSVALDKAAELIAARVAEKNQKCPSK